jgi:phage N-6-adenine-methyltransferase
MPSLQTDTVPVIAADTPINTQWKPLLSSQRQTWETPPDFFAALHADYHFTLDAAASAQNTKCAHYFTADDDALTRPWPGVVWCNPPYGRKIGVWLKKAHEEVLTNPDCRRIVMLLPARTDTKWFHTYVWPHREGIESFSFLRGRLRFVGSPHPAPFPSMLVVFGRGRARV